MMMHTVKCFLILFIVPLSSFAQFKNVRLDEAASANAASQPSITINKKNPSNIIAASGLNAIYHSIDGGITWQSVQLNSSHGVYGNPVLICDDKGDVYSFHLSDPSNEGRKNEKSLEHILCHISKDGGKTWEEGSPIGSNSSKDQDKPWATVDSKGNVWVAWTQFDKYNNADENCQSNILLSTSSNGKKWSRPVQLSQTPGDCKDDDKTAVGAVPAIGVDGKAFVAWSNQDKIFLDRSFNGGGLWLSNDIAIGQQPGGWSMKVPGYERCSGAPVLMIDQSKTVFQGSLYLIWADQRDGENDTDVWFMRSTNFGDNWTSPIQLREDKNKRHQYMPAMTVDQATGIIYAIFYDRDGYEDNQTDVYVSYSIDGGSSFKSVKISETPFTPTEGGAGSYANICAHKGVITPIWTRVEDGKTSIWTTTIKQSDLIQTPQASGKKKKK